VRVLTDAEVDAEFAKYPVDKATKKTVSTISKDSLGKDPVPSKRPVKYLNNRDLLAQVILSKTAKPVPKMTNDLAKMLQLLTSRYAKKGNFANYTYNDDMQSYAMLMLVKTWNSFDPAKSSNPFAFFTQCIKNSFIQYLNYEKRQRDIRDEVLVDKGMAPSFGFTYDYEEKQREADVADQEVMEAPTKLHEDVDNFDVGPDTGEDDPTSES
jgi:DNA-directed RNA polymerase specialized sigma24 family protein